MSCPVCAGPCHCGRENEATTASAPPHVTVLVDPEQFVGSEERFAATLTRSSRPEWRQEVATRVRGFRRRRSRHPADDSMELDFCSASDVVDDSAADISIASTSGPDPDDPGPPEFADNTEFLPQNCQNACNEDPDGQEAKIIEFPRLLEETPWQAELAEPVELPPRIFEAEAEEVVEAEQTQQAGAESLAAASVPSFVLDAIPTEPLHSEEPVFIETAPLHLRAIAAAIDLGLVLVAEWVFALILLPMGAVPAGRNALLLFAVAGLGLWSLYQYLFMMYREGTPGMDATRLVLMSFEQVPPSRRQLRARTCGAVLSALACGLGFAWAGLDEDALCWHDRISRTCLVIPDWP